MPLHLCYRGGNGIVPPKFSPQFNASSPQMALKAACSLHSRGTELQLSHTQLVQFLSKGASFVFIIFNEKRYYITNYKKGCLRFKNVCGLFCASMKELWKLLEPPEKLKILYPYTRLFKPIRSLKKVSLTVFWEVAMNGRQNNPHMFLKLRHL